MNGNFNKRTLYPWTLALALAGLIALPWSGNEVLTGQPGPEVDLLFHFGSGLTRSGRGGRLDFG